ncbi:site-specific integrase [Streptomyces sp. NPDC051658]|uniref:site-specific integrase n=1 Tax=Streptomyces sp. NPDC051658 TaxID=3365667 RepID=UPI003794E962
MNGLSEEVLADPVGLVVRLVGNVERHLEADRIREIVCTVMRERAGRRRLAQALHEDPSLLRTGRPPAPFCVARLLMALHEAGAQDIALPRCGECGRARPYVGSRSGGRWGCSPCFDKAADCAGCHQQRRVVSRDRHGNPRCAKCPDTDGDPFAMLAGLITTVDPTLDAGAVQAALDRATVRKAGQRRLAWAITAQPDLLTGAGYDAPTPAVLRFIDALVQAGATRVVNPACYRCHEVKSLSKVLDGKRVCRNCFARNAAVPCTRCGSVREPAARDAEGRPLCPNCLVSDPVNLEECRDCGRRQKVAARLPDGPRCANCRPRTAAQCGICGRTGVCEISRATGEPWCNRCQLRWAPCSGCGAVDHIRSGTWDAPLCAKCTNPDPDYWGRCPVCRTTWQLSTRPCQRCALDRQVRDLLAGNTGTIRQDLVPLYKALSGAERPTSTMFWLSGSKVGGLLRQIGRDERPVTHDTLDELPASKVLAHLRSVLVATGALPPRDERLVALDQWITSALQARTDLTERRILHGYAVWHHLRRLRRRLGQEHTTHLQALNVRCHVTAAANFLDWLSDSALTLGTCTQVDLERWIADPKATYRDETSHFVRWSVQHRHAKGLTYGTVRWTGPCGTIDSEKRWADARRLLHDDTLATSDRVAGLLLVLYAQQIATISRLTVDDVHLDNDKVGITFGTSPVVLPEPLAGLVRDLIATRRGKARIGAPDDAPWLFPGGRPGQPIGDDRLGLRLQKIGLQPRQDRSTALFTLATEVPAAILARMLGVHIQVAVQWQKASAGDWAAYAAEVSRRAPTPAGEAQTNEVPDGQHPRTTIPPGLTT